MSPFGLAPGIFEAFNARALEPAQVARSFVPSPSFDQLSKVRHTIVVGPRGSGKTTLLKMLQPPALEAWHHAEADKYRARVTYTGVFVPADVIWGAQVDTLGGGRLGDEALRLLGGAAFTAHVLRAAVAAMAHRAHAPHTSELTPHRRVRLSEAAERKLVRACATSWHLEVDLPTLNSLRRALTTRLSAIHELANREMLLDASTRAARLAATPFLHLHFLQALEIAVEMFEDVVRSRSDSRKWALLFDELELAPKWIRDDLLRSLRSTADRFIFKLSMSPYSETSVFAGPLSPSPGNDFDSIPLWYAEKEDGYAFSRALLASMLSQHAHRNRVAEDLLGTWLLSTTRTPLHSKSSAYASRSRLGKRFRLLADSDRTFRDYLKASGVELDEIDELTESERAAEIRKISQLVVVRQAFRTPDVNRREGDKRALRSRKSPNIYAGAECFFALVEGNPRWLIGIVERLLGGWDGSRPIKPPVQMREIERAADLFRAVLKTIPCPRVGGELESRGILSLLDRIGDFFQRKVTVEPFNGDPPLSFTIDSNVAIELEASVSRALNAGAIVYVPEETSNVLLSSLRGKRFRLSYLLAPKNALPVRLGRAVSLGQILGQKTTQDLPLFPKENADE